MRALTNLAALVALATVGFAVGDWAGHINALGAVGILLLIAAFAFLLSFLYRPTRAPAAARDGEGEREPEPRRRRERPAGAASWDAAEAGLARSRRRGAKRPDAVRDDEARV